MKDVREAMNVTPPAPSKSFSRGTHPRVANVSQVNGPIRTSFQTCTYLTNKPIIQERALPMY